MNRQTSLLYKKSFINRLFKFIKGGRDITYLLLSYILINIYQSREKINYLSLFNDFSIAQPYQISD